MILIILAVISINSVFGEDGLIASAERGGIEHTHAMVWEAIEMEYSNYWIDKVMLGGDLITYLQGEDKGIIGKELQGAGYVINVEKLLGNRMSLGNGTDGTNDVYKLEPLQTEEANIAKVASTEENVKLAEGSTRSESEYQVKYYGPSGDRVLGILGDNISSLIEDDNPNFEITKKAVSTPKNEKYYTVGEQIKYVIMAKNKGNVPIKDIHIVDELTAGSGTYKPGDEHLVLSEENSGKVKAGEEYWIIDSLEAGESETITYTYEVQQGDIEEGKIIVNVITDLTGVPQPTVPKGHKVPPVEIPVEPQPTPPPPGPQTEYTSLSVTKVWNDVGNEDKRPESVQVQLFCNGSEYNSPVVLSESNGWSYTWNYLVKDCEYTVDEVTPNGYTATVTSSENGYTITNTYFESYTPPPPGPPETPPEETPPPDTPDKT